MKAFRNHKSGFAELGYVEVVDEKRCVHRFPTSNWTMSEKNSKFVSKPRSVCTNIVFFFVFSFVSFMLMLAESHQFPVRSKSK